MIPITILTGFLGSGKTTIILNLLPQLPKDYKVALLKNEFGDLAVDSQLASSAAVSGVQELLNGCICCNLVGQLGDALETLRSDVKPDRIIIETSGSAFPATLAMEVNRLGRETGHYTLDGVVSVIDVENWKGYDDTSYTAKMQARYTDLIVFNKWELVDERRYDECLDRVGDLDVQVATIKSDKGFVPQGLLLGLDSVLAKSLSAHEKQPHGDHEHAEDHQSEAEVLSVAVKSAGAASVRIRAFEAFLDTVPRDEVYRIKGLLRLGAEVPRSLQSGLEGEPDQSSICILNWAFGRWTFTWLTNGKDVAQAEKDRKEVMGHEAMIRLTIVTARGESGKWRKKLAEGTFLGLDEKGSTEYLEVHSIS